MSARARQRAAEAMPLPFCHLCRLRFAPGEHMKAAADHVFHDRCWSEVADLGMAALQGRYPTPLEDQLTKKVQELENELAAANGRTQEQKTLRERAQRKLRDSEKQVNDQRTAIQNMQIALRNAAPPPPAPAMLAATAPAVPASAAPAPAPPPVDRPADDSADRFSQIELD